MTPAEEEIAYYYELGRALAAWAHIEARLVDAVLRCVDGELEKNSLAMGVVSIQGFRNKLMFIGAMIRRTIAATPNVKDWDAVQEKLSAESAKRNDLAHFQTQAFPDGPVGRRFALCPWHAPKPHDSTKPAPGSYCLLDLVAMRHGFEATDARLANFIARACGEAEPFPRSDEQPENPPQLEQIRRRIHAELGHPQKSSREKRREEDEKNAAASLSVEFPNVKTDETPRS